MKTADFISFAALHMFFEGAILFFDFSNHFFEETTRASGRWQDVISCDFVVIPGQLLWPMKKFAKDGIGIAVKWHVWRSEAALGMGKNDRRWAKGRRK
ncbi:MAG: hypothetical protein LBM04_01975 [Opitutaceae bacterium]|jgi:hypothetical protein|nr:hypothetical protein [Opitutaceae bacterium]